MLLHCVVQSSPQIVQRLIKDGRYAYKVQVPILISLQTSSRKNSANNYIATITVERCDVKQNFKGIWITSVIIK